MLSHLKSWRQSWSSSVMQSAKSQLPRSSSENARHVSRAHSVQNWLGGCLEGALHLLHAQHAP
eukprot:7648294-Lingulodinium_polyedra.AAC.1